MQMLDLYLLCLLYLSDDYIASNQRSSNCISTVFFLVFLLYLRMELNEVELKSDLMQQVLWFFLSICSLALVAYMWICILFYFVF